MRPVNLMPAEERRGEHGPMRSGALVYVVVGALVLVLAGLTALVLTNNQISDHKSDIARLEAEDAKAEAKARELAAYTQLRNLRETRLQTISSLADSRFDWERVMRELALILPSDVALTDLSATASSDADVESSGGGGGGGDLRSAVPGPALTMQGCAHGQEGVAGFVTALKDIDGVTRVGVEVSELPVQRAGAGSTEGKDSEKSGGDDECESRSYLASFSIVVAFDAAPVPETDAAAEVASATEQAETTSTEAEGG